LRVACVNRASLSDCRSRDHLSVVDNVRSATYAPAVSQPDGPAAPGPIALASDHGGFELKEALEAYLKRRGYAVLDVGTHDKTACDYPVFAQKAAEAVASGQAWRGVIVDGAGIGSCMAANKIPGVRAGMAFDTRTAHNAREHNDANVLTLGAGYLDETQARAIVDVFLSVDCTVDRHRRRVALIDALDRPRMSPPRSPSMSTSPPDQSQLVAAITKVLTENPALIPAGAPGAVAMTCNTSAGGACPTCTPCTTCSPCTGNCSIQDPKAVRQVLGGRTECRVSARLGAQDVPQDLAALIDHTLLKADATYDEIDELCAEAAQCGFASVCVNPMHVARAAGHLAGSRAKVCTVIGFPLGATPKENKVLEARRAVRDGARELDMVIAVGALKSGDYDHVYEDIRAVVEVGRDSRCTVKVIIETALLTDEEKVMACMLAKKARAHFVKTSTGFSKSGATAADVALMARAVDYQLEVKASGGVRSSEDAHKMIQAGATRIGASVGVKIAGCNVSTGRTAAAY